MLGVLTNKTQSAGYITGPLYGERIYLRYYQWLVFIYFIMAASFRFPAFLWRLTEGGRLQGICEGLGNISSQNDISSFCFFNIFFNS